MFWRRALHFAFNALETLFEKILQIPSNTIDRKEAEIMYVKIAILMGKPDLRGIDTVQPVF